MSDTALSTQSIISHLQSHRSEVRSRFGLDLIGLCGSHASGRAGEASDIDVAVRKSRPIHLGDVVSAKLWLEELLSRPVDLIFVEALPGYKRALVEEHYVELS